MDGNGSKHSLVYPDSRYLERGKTSQSRFLNTSRLRNCSFPRDTRAITRLTFGFPTVSFTEKILREKEKPCLSFSLFLSLSLSFSSLPTFVSRSWRSLIITRQFHEEKRKRRKERKKERKSRIAIQRIKHIYIYCFFHGGILQIVYSFDCVPRVVSFLDTSVTSVTRTFTSNFIVNRVVIVVRFHSRSSFDRIFLA